MSGYTYPFRCEIMGETVCVYPERGISGNEAEEQARDQSSIVVTVSNLVVYVTDGEKTSMRDKLILPGRLLTSNALRSCKVFEVSGVKILPIICYELIFPDLWFNVSPKPDLITISMGFPMLNVFQLEGWDALVKCMALRYYCPVVVVCGDVNQPYENTVMNPTGIVYPKRHIRDYSGLYKEEKYNPYPWKGEV